MNHLYGKVAKAFDLLADPSMSVKQVAKCEAPPLDTVNSLAYRGAYKAYRPLNWCLPERRPLVRQVKIGRKLYQSFAAAARDQGMSTKGVVHRVLSDNCPD